MKLALVTVVLGMVVFLYACARAPRIAPAEAKRMVAAGAVLVDVRSPEEFASGHIQGAKNLPVGELSGRLAEVGPKETDVVVYCRSGMRSARAAKTLKEAGFTKVHDLGGMSNW